MSDSVASIGLPLAKSRTLRSFQALQLTLVDAEDDPSAGNKTFS